MHKKKKEQYIFWSLLQANWYQKNPASNSILSAGSNEEDDGKSLLEKPLKETNQCNTKNQAVPCNCIICANNLCGPQSQQHNRVSNAQYCNAEWQHDKPYSRTRTIILSAA